MKKKKHILIHIIMIITAIMFIYPFLIVLGSSFQSSADLNANGYSIIPGEFSLLSYKAILQNPKSLLRAYGVTIYTSVITVFFGTLISTSCAYVMTRKNYRYRKLLTTFIFIPMLLNGGMVANYINIVKNLGLKDNIWVLILPLLISSWYILLLRDFWLLFRIRLWSRQKLMEPVNLKYLQK